MSKTKIKLEYPYCNDWKYGYVVVNNEGRETLILYNSHTDRSSTQYARYLISIKLGRYLTDEETVDHIDGNKHNNDLDNLQVLSLKDNVRKTHLKPTTYLEGVCYVCSKVFYINNKLRRLPNTKKEDLKNGLLCCSATCGRVKMVETKRNNKIS